MNALAAMWAQRRLEQLEYAHLCALIKELREAQAAAAPLIEKANQARKAAMRQDGPTGFVMVQRK